MLAKSLMRPAMLCTSFEEPLRIPALLSGHHVSECCQLRDLLRATRSSSMWLCTKNRSTARHVDVGLRTPAEPALDRIAEKQNGNNSFCEQIYGNRAKQTEPIRKSSRSRLDSTGDWKPLSKRPCHASCGSFAPHTKPTPRPRAENWTEQCSA